jgi:hypothetical protein
MHPGNSSPSEGDCGLGVPVPVAQANEIWGRWCPQHQHLCWRRENPLEIAQAAMMIEAIQKRESTDIDELPPLELVEEARQMLLRDGMELFIDA